MDLNCEPDEEYIDCMFYIKDINDSKDLCLICMTDETEEGKQWTRYKIKCGHVFHSRCFRRWCGMKNCLNCSCCGDLPEDKSSRYCNKCDEFGHNCAVDRWEKLELPEREIRKVRKKKNTRKP